MNQPAFLEISDSCVRATEGGKLGYEEPGIALLAPGNAPVLGREAQQVFRQQPTRIHSRFWSELSTDPIRMKDSSVRHGADLVWHQLSQIKERIDAQSLCVCLPSQMSHAQMQLLTGICDSLDLHVGYLVNMGLAQLAARDINTDTIHLDLQLHQLVISTYRNTEGSLGLENQEVIQSISFLRIVDRFMHVLRDQFIQGNRFDPLHSGDTEQQLFDQVLRMLNSGQLRVFEIRSGAQIHRVEPSPKDFSSLVTSLKHEVDQIVPANRARVFSPEFGLLPDFQVSEQDTILGARDTLAGAEKLIESQSSSEGTIFVSSWQTDTPSVNAQNSVDSENKATLANALLYRNIVYSADNFEQIRDAGFNVENFVIHQDGQLAEKTSMLPIEAGQTFNVDGETVTAVYFLG